MTSTVHILDRFVPELERYLLIDEIGCYLIAEGLLSNEDYLMLVGRPSKKVAVVELLQMVKRKEPDSLQRFLHALHRSCTDSSTPHEGHNHLYELIQASISSAHMHPLKKRKSKSVLSSVLKWNKNSKSNKEVSSLLWVSTPHTNHSYNPSSCTCGTTTFNPLTSNARYSIISSGTSGGSDDDNNRYSIYDSTSSQDSYNPEFQPPPPPQPPLPPLSTGPTVPNNTNQRVIEDLQKENKDLTNSLKKKTKELEKCKAKVKEQSLRIEDLKADKERYKNKMQTLEVEHLALQVEANENASRRDELELKLRKVMQEKESLKKVGRSSICGPSSKPQRTQSLGYRGSGSLFTGSCTSLTSIHEIKIEKLKSEVNRNDEVFDSKLGELAKMCEGTREPSKLNRKWHSDIRLVQHYYRENNSPSLHSQT